MKIKLITSQHHRDFYAVYQCEHCGHEVEGSGYDDDDFHEHVIPKMACPKCKKSASDGYTPLTPKYTANEVV